MTIVPEETYIGDGVYASIDPAHMIKLRTSRCDRDDEIFLEPEVWENLLTFAKAAGWPTGGEP